MVVGTDNAPESYTGAKYGDGGVRAWARALGLPELMAGRVPTAGLGPGQTSEAEMSITYDMSLESPLLLRLD